MNQICVVGLGTGAEGPSAAAWVALKAGDPVILRTEEHCSADALRQAGIPFISLDKLYKSNDDFDALNNRVSAELLRLAQRNGRIVYAVPGQGIFGESSLESLLREEQAHVRISFIPSMDEACDIIAKCGSFASDALNGYMSVPASSLGQTRLNTAMALVVSQIDSRISAGDVKLILAKEYGDEKKVALSMGESISFLSLHELDHQEMPKNGATLYVPAACNGEGRYAFQDLVEIMDRLRAPGGCPWDREQTFDSLMQYLLEECYEVIQAVNQHDWEGLCEELGDVLLQVVFNAKIADERMEFDIGDVTDGVCRKMIRRHPHIFGDVSVENAQQVVENWEKIKKQEKGHQQKSPMRSIPVELPALVYASKIGSKAKDAHAERRNIDQLRKELDIQLRSMLDNAKEIDDKTAGNILFLLCLLFKKSGIHSELVLKERVEAYIQRIEKLEAEIQTQGRKMEDVEDEEIAHFPDLTQ